jgi:ferrochelatase
VFFVGKYILFTEKRKLYEKNMKQRGILLVNLGTPSSTKIKDVRNYLNEFLMDHNVIDLPWIFRKLIVNCLVLPFRPKKSAAAYKSIWSKHGSPLLVNSYKLANDLQQVSSLPIEVAMRYGEPSIKNGIKKLISNKVTEILVIPLYPHYAMSSYKTVVEKTNEVINSFNVDIKLIYHPVFYNDDNYIKALVDSATPWMQQHYDHLLFSFHGVPARHIKKDDPTKHHCLKTKGCCFKQKCVSHLTCYQHQVIQTMESFAALAKISKSKYSLGFQSRLGKDKWLTPNTLDVLDSLAASRKLKVLVICPSFVSDCLESLEEIGIAAKEYFFTKHGGELNLIPCMNQHPSWINALKIMCNYQSKPR